MVFIFLRPCFFRNSIRPGEGLVQKLDYFRGMQTDTPGSEVCDVDKRHCHFLKSISNSVIGLF